LFITDIFKQSVHQNICFLIHGPQPKKEAWGRATALRLGYLCSGHPQVASPKEGEETFWLTVYALERYYPNLGTAVLARMDFPSLSTLLHFP